MITVNSDYPHGLSSRDIKTIQLIFRPYLDEIERVGLFGSRATGTYKPYSDIDFVLFGEKISETLVNKLLGLFEESSLPYKVDIVAYHHIKKPELITHIDKVVLFLNDLSNFK